MKIGVLLAGHTPQTLLENHGDFDTMFARLLSGHGFTFAPYPVVDDVFPNSIHDADGWLLSGSKFATYENHDWIAPLEEFIRHAYAASIPLVGVCFGHQILAQALGGKVEKFGWVIGPQEYQTDQTTERVFSWHQDQVIHLPPDATAVGSSQSCQYAMIDYGKSAFSVQPHPEFTRHFMQDLFAERQHMLPANIVKQVRHLLATPGTLTSGHLAERMANVFRLR